MQTSDSSFLASSNGLSSLVDRINDEVEQQAPCAVCGNDGRGRQNFVVWYPAEEPRPAEFCAACGRESVIVKVLYGVSADDL